MMVKCNDDDCPEYNRCMHSRPHQYDKTLCPNPFGCDKCTHVESSECRYCQEKDKRIQSLEAKLKVAVGLLEDISLQCECNSCNVACSEEFAVTCVEWKARAALKEIVE